MKLNKLISAAFIFSASLFNDAFATGFNESLIAAYKNNPALYSARESVKATDENMPAAIAGMLPSVSASVGIGERDTTIGASETNNDTDIKNISVTQPLFRGGQTVSGIKQAKSSIMAARSELRSTEQDVLLQAVSAYMDIVRDKEVLELSKNNISVLETHLKVTKERFKLGEITKTDVAQSEASLSRAIYDKTAAEGALESSRATYERVIGLKPGELENVENPVSITASLSEIIDMAMKENPAILAAEYNKDSAKSDVNIQKGKLLPRVDFTAKKEKQGGSIYSTNDIDSDIYTVDLSIPIFQAGSEYSSVRRAKSTLGKYNYDYIDKQNTVREAVIRAYNDLQVATAIIVSNQAVIDSLIVVLKGVQQEAKVGARTTLDVLDAEHDLFVAKVNLVRSKRDQIVNSYTLLAQIGRLNTKELGLDVEAYDPTKNYNKRKFQIIGF